LEVLKAAIEHEIIKVHMSKSALWY